MLKVLGLTKNYKSKLTIFKNKAKSINAVNDISFSLNKNEILGLVGESGCGKSTLARLLVRLEKPTRGTIIYNGKDIWDIRKKEMNIFRKQVQVIFQDTYCSLNPNLKVIDSLMEPLNNHFKEKSKEDKIKKIKNLINFASLDENILSRYPSEISGGERQRINICRALLLKPKMLICDEITSSLDVCTQAYILDMIKKLRNQYNTSILFISHDIISVDYLCDRIMVMKDGKLIEDIENKKFGLNSFTKEYTRELISSVPKRYFSNKGIFNK